MGGRMEPHSIAERSPVTAINGMASALPSVAEQLPGQTQLEQAINRLIHAGRARRASLALLQLANFYEIRTWVGKSEASQLLADIARVLMRRLPAAVNLYRCENYEFALLLKDECSSNAQDIIRQLQSALENAASATIPAQLTLHCVAGLVDITPELRDADVALARARHDLRGLDKGQQDDLSASQIVIGLRRGQLQLNYQPLLALHRSRQPIIEVRSALQGHNGPVSGRALHRAAEIHALGQALDRAVINSCLQLLQLKRLRDYRLLVRLSLNSLVSPAFYDWLEQKLQALPFQRQRLILQISEADLLVAQHHLAEFDRAMQAIALPLGICHFGCNRDPLRFLSLLDIQLVKLDISLTRNLQDNSVRLQALEELTRSLHAQDIQAVACFVEKLNCLPPLWRSGIDWLQGMCLGTASPHIVAPQLLRLQLD